MASRRSPSVPEIQAAFSLPFQPGYWICAAYLRVHSRCLQPTKLPACHSSEHTGSAQLTCLSPRRTVSVLPRSGGAAAALPSLADGVCLLRDATAVRVGFPEGSVQADRLLERQLRTTAGTAFRNWGSLCRSNMKEQLIRVSKCTLHPILHRSAWYMQPIQTRTAAKQ